MWEELYWNGNILQKSIALGIERNDVDEWNGVKQITTKCKKGKMDEETYYAKARKYDNDGKSAVRNLRRIVK